MPISSFEIKGEEEFLNTYNFIQRETKGLHPHILDLVFQISPQVHDLVYDKKIKKDAHLLPSMTCFFSGALALKNANLYRKWLSFTQAKPLDRVRVQEFQPTLTNEEKMDFHQVIDDTLECYERIRKIPLHKMEKDFSWIMFQVWLSLFHQKKVLYFKPVKCKCSYVGILEILDGNLEIKHVTNRHQIPYVLSRSGKSIGISAVFHPPQCLLKPFMPGFFRLTLKDLNMEEQAKFFSFIETREFMFDLYYYDIEQHTLNAPVIDLPLDLLLIIKSYMFSCYIL